MRASLKGRDELALRVQQALDVPTKKQAEQIVDVVIGSLEQTLLHIALFCHLHSEAAPNTRQSSRGLMQSAEKFGEGMQ